LRRRPQSPIREAHGETKALVRKAIGDLPLPYRIVLVMRDMEQLSTQEVAEALGSPKIATASADASDLDAMTALIDEYALLYPGVKRVEHVYFYAVHGADEATRHGYLDRAYALGREF
jgi:hypothetical protein